MLLTVSNVFMTFAWYGHLRNTHSPLWKAVMVSWGIAFFEYCFQVPANRMGYTQFSAAQLKTIEVITPQRNPVFNSVSKGRPEMELRCWLYIYFGAVFFVFKKW